MNFDLENNKSTIKKIAVAVISAAALVLAVLVGPMDYFQKGYVYDVPSRSGIAQADILGEVTLSEGYSLSFMPKNNHLTGFLINTENIPEDKQGEVLLTVTDGTGKKIEEKRIGIGYLTERKFFQVFTDGKYKADTVYTLNLKAENCTSSPVVKLVDNSYIGEESMGDNLLIGYAYTQSVFSAPERVLIAVFIAAVYMLILNALLDGKKQLIYKSAMCILLVAVLSWNYMYSTFNRDSFDVGSEQFVTGAILAEENDVPLSAYGMGRYYYTAGGGGSMFYQEQDELGYFLTDENYTYVKGYSESKPEIVLYLSDPAVDNLYIPGHYIEFSNGDIHQIAEVKKSEGKAYITLDTDEELSYHKNGNLKNVTFYDTNMTPLHKGVFVPYTSSYGLQGKVFRHICRITGFEYLNLICAGALAVVLVFICMLINKKYNFLMAVCFYITFLLSPWMISFAKNLYWSQFLWFIPMLVGLLCSVYIDSRKTRIICYIATVVSICLKCLCGYEYITSIMMGLIAFLLVDFVIAVCSKDKKKAMLVFRTVVVLGICALAGFAFAMLLHARVMGNGNLVEGLRKVYTDVALKRISFGAMENYNDTMWVSVNVSIWQVICMFFDFATPVIAGIDGTLFPLISALPLAIFAYNASKGKKDTESITLYVVTFAVTMSWHILAKSHSYVHPHMNFVLWYMGFVQICFYVIAKQFADKLKK